MSPWRLPSHPPAGICCCGDLLPWRLPSRPPAGYPTEMSYITPFHFRLILLSRPSISSLVPGFLGRLHLSSPALHFWKGPFQVGVIAMLLHPGNLHLDQSSLTPQLKACSQHLESAWFRAMLEEPTAHRELAGSPGSLQAEA